MHIIIMSDLPTVPFGRYKNKPITEMLKDKSYVNWCKNKEGLLDKYPIIYNIIYTQSFEKQDNPTPKHNKMQNLFLDKNMNIKLVNKITNINNIGNYILKIFKKLYIDHKYQELFEAHRFDIPKSLSYDINTEFEAKYNWDVSIKCDCEIDDYDKGNYDIMIEKKTTRIYHDEYKYYHQNFKKYYPFLYDQDRNESYYYDNIHRLYIKKNYEYLLFIELKPNLGDDYPCVLRKMKKQIELTKIYCNNNYHGWKISYILIIDEYESETTSTEQLKQIFKQSNIHIIFLNQDLLE